MTPARVFTAVLLCASLPALCGCEAIDVWRVPASTPEQYAKGLIVFYPGSSNLHMELLGFYHAIREAGIDLAVEETHWSAWLESIFASADQVQPGITEIAKADSARIAEYIRTHPGAPVTLLTYSAGAVCALQVAANMPPDAPVDRVVLMSPAIWKGTDLTAALAGSRLGIVSYWSPRDEGPTLVARYFHLGDSTSLDPACTFTFDQKDPKLTEISWTPDMTAMGNNGGHLDYLINLPWLKTHVVPWIVTPQ